MVHLYTQVLKCEHGTINRLPRWRCRIDRSARIVHCRRFLLWRRRRLLVTVNIAESRSGAIHVVAYHAARFLYAPNHVEMGQGNSLQEKTQRTMNCCRPMPPVQFRTGTLEPATGQTFAKRGLSAKFKGRWGLKSLSVVDAQKMHASFNVLRGENTEVPQGSVFWVFAQSLKGER